MFGKQAYVGLGKSGIGDVYLGRQYDYTFSYRALYAFLNCGVMIFENADLDRASGERLNNAVQFNSANFAGFSFGAMYAFGQDAGASSTNIGRAYSGNLQYSYGPFSAALVISDINKVGVPAGATGAPSLLGQRLTPSTVLLVDNQRILGAAGMYGSAAGAHRQSTPIPAPAERQLGNRPGGTCRRRLSSPAGRRSRCQGVLRKLDDSHWYSVAAC